MLGVATLGVDDADAGEPLLGSGKALALVTCILIFVTVVLVGAAWLQARHPEQVSSLLLDYCRRKLPAGAECSSWTRREFEEVARKHRWR